MPKEAGVKTKKVTVEVHLTGDSTTPKKEKVKDPNKKKDPAKKKDPVEKKEKKEKKEKVLAKEDEKKCAGFKKDGRPCQYAVAPGNRVYCKNHMQKRKEKEKEKEPEERKDE
jgi:hypothetical protein